MIEAIITLPRNKQSKIRKRIIDNSFPITESGCWIWMKGTDKNGYGVFSINNKSVRSHRIIYEIHKGIIPIGMEVCHKCDVPACVNPNHLFIGTRKDNALDSLKKGRHWQANKKTCFYGHYNYINLKRGGRYCKICNKENSREIYRNILATETLEEREIRLMKKHNN